MKNKFLNNATRSLYLMVYLASSISFAGEEVTVGVKGMVCAFCAQGIEKKFKAQPEVEKVQVSLQNKYVKLNFKDDKRVSNEKIIEILKDAGYEANISGK
jgi:periplasmic mercuric ion binding protein